MLAARAEIFFEPEQEAAPLLRGHNLKPKHAERKAGTTGTDIHAGANTQAGVHTHTDAAAAVNLAKFSSTARPQPATRKAFLAATLIYGAIVAGFWASTLIKPEVMQLEVGGATYSIGLEQFVAAPAPQATVTPEPEAMVQPEPEPVVQPEPEPVVQPEPEPVVEKQPEPVVEKQPEPVVEKKPEPKPEPTPPVVKKEVKAVKEVKPQPKPQPQKAVAAPAPQPTQATKTASQATGTPQANRPQVMVYGRDNHPVLAQIKGAIDGALVYPRKAQMMRAEGVAVVQFTYTTAGGIKRLKLLKSTGNRDLDKAALLTIKRAAGNFPRVEQNFTLRLPISFEIR